MKKVKAKKGRKGAPSLPRPEVPPVEEQQELLRVNQTGLVLGVSEMTAYRLIKRGLIPWIKLGRHIRVPRRELLRLIAANALSDKV